MAALFLYFSCFEEAHRLLENCETTEGELWHAILHRREPDTGNAAYWFRKAGPHPTFTLLAHAAVRILHRIRDAEFRTGRWDPFAFAAFCDRARKQPGSAQMRAAMEIQRAEWQILFDYCARLSE
jgi:5-methylcytosine-specific restriction endonuclease McrBC GTP-binding regulatory subunit McrB